MRHLRPDTFKAIDRLKKTFTVDTDFREGYVINVDKPYEWTSTDVVRRLRGLLRAMGYRRIKIGHAGTLDPLATGVLLICVGRPATRRVEELQDEAKEYVADIMLGATTPSHDLEHPIDKTYPYEHITRERVEEVLKELSGERLQMPPLYSAKWIDGKRAYDYAREGKEVEMRKAAINIYEMELLSHELPLIRVRVSCSKGTYIRSLAYEIGETLESGGHLSALRRTRSGDYLVEDGYQLDDLVECFQELIELKRQKLDSEQ